MLAPCISGMSADSLPQLQANSGVYKLRMAGKIYVNDPNTAASDAYTVGSLRAGFEQRGKRWRIAEFVRVDNITDRQYVGSVIVADGNGRFYEPSPGRNWLAGINAALSF
jgi:iron complex outermembrane receptor protein